MPSFNISLPTNRLFKHLSAAQVHSSGYLQNYLHIFLLFNWYVLSSICLFIWLHSGSQWQHLESLLNHAGSFIVAHNSPAVAGRLRCSMVNGILVSWPGNWTLINSKANLQPLDKPGKSQHLYISLSLEIPTCKKFRGIEVETIISDLDCIIEIFLLIHSAKLS